MNGRIKELAEQARKEFLELPTGYIPEQVGMYPQLMEKFAELIVRECIKESLEEIVSDDEIEEENDPIFKEYFKGNNQGIVDAVVRFRNHFGVEE